MAGATKKDAQVKEDPEIKGKAKRRKKDAEETEVKKERVKKVYELPGQTKETPLETDSLRKFYASLRQQMPDSAMAEKWLLVHGLLPEDEAQQVFDRLASSKGGLRSPAKTPRPKAGSSGAAAARKPRASADAKPPHKAAESKPAVKRKQVKTEPKSEDEGSDAPLAKRVKPAGRKLPVAKGNNQAAKPQKRKRVASSSEDEDSGESDGDDSDFEAVADDIVPSKKPKGVAKPPAKQLSGKSSLKSQGSGRSNGKAKEEPKKAPPAAAKAGVDNFSSDESDDDVPLASRVR